MQEDGQVLAPSPAGMAAKVRATDFSIAAIMARGSRAAAAAAHAAQARSGRSPRKNAGTSSKRQLPLEYQHREQHRHGVF
ncbi:hypothetical protein ONE63_004315 [Megalurothrips usitatus]|uniref:Uncharacterized protein n=1 Tax=Megalurothrips usitatus TaxID=439358 RepID=A0AAV7X2F3_9NEOP|nr:hypothetical protein ONE63_004315 [Megalurothrips usitatus]